MKFIFSGLTLALAFLAVACGTSSNTVTGPSTDRCAISVSNSSPSVGAPGGTGRLTVTTGRECTWSMTSNVPWITFTSAANGQGDGTVDYLVAANADAEVRRGRVGTGAQTVEVAQQGLTCQFDLQPANHSAGAAGGTASVDVSVASGCNWTPGSSDDWITITNGGSRNGSGVVTFSVSPNTGVGRNGGITIGGRTFAIAQAAPACRYQLSAVSQTFSGAGGAGLVTVAAASTCNWTAASNAPWISVVGGAADNGNGTVSFSVQPNTGAARNGTITIAGQTFTVAQVQAECNYSISPAGQSFGVSGGSGTVSITTNSVCTWNTSDVPAWVTGLPASGTGSQSLSFSVDANAGAARSANIILGGQTFALTQAAGCTYTLTPGSHNAPAGGGPSSFNVNTAIDCGWTSSGVPSWISGVPASGIGPQGISFTVASNAGPARSATLTVAGRPFVVNQAGGCSYSLMPGSHSASASGGPSSFALTTTAGCGWTSSGVPSWVTGVPASGNGPATINFTVAANSGGTRSANIVVGGQTFAVDQAAVACSFSFAPSSHSATAGGGSSSFDVTTSASCGWTSGGVPAWITGVPASGTGPLTINFTVAANPDPSPRSANVTIGGQTFTVNQAALACSYTLAPGSHSATAGGGPSSFDVTTTSSCGWTSSGVPAWISGVPASGTGTTTINFTVAANTDPASRSANITIGGQTFTVNQAAASAPCSYSLTPTSHNTGASGGPSSFDITTTAACDWTSSGVPAWVTGVPTNGTGTTTINFTVAANPDPVARSVNITIGGQTFTVNQAAAVVPCSYSLNPTSRSLPSAGGPSSVDVVTTAGCDWTTSGVPAWISGVPGTGTGPATINFTADANTGGARSANLTIAGQAFTVNQASGCTYSLAPGSHSASAAGGSSSFDITTTAGCDWTSIGVPSWITGVPGTGTGTTTINFTVAANTGPDRSASINMSGQTFSVTQASGCAYSVSPGSFTLGALGGPRDVTLTTTAGCPWTAAVNRPWINITSSATGTGGTTISLTIELNLSFGDRSGELTVGGQTVTINQTFP